MKRGTMVEHFQKIMLGIDPTDSCPAPQTGGVACARNWCEACAAPQYRGET
jgi:hypothetical protein